MNIQENLDPGILPDLVSQAVPKEKAAGPWEWGVAYSLGSHPKSYDMFSNPNDWYLECYYGFDVIFTDC